jgi:hypothetical protein
MSERIYVECRNADRILGKINMPVTRTTTETRKTLFGKFKYVDVTTTKREDVSVPLLLYREDGKIFEFFTGREVFETYNSYNFCSDVIPTEVKSRKYADFRIEKFSRANTRVCNATAFAELVEKWMPYKDEIVKRIENHIRETNEQYLKDVAKEKADQERAMSAEEKSEAWLDSMIRKGKF